LTIHWDSLLYVALKLRCTKLNSRAHFCWLIKIRTCFKSFSCYINFICCSTNIIDCYFFWSRSMNISETDLWKTIKTKTKDRFIYKYLFSKCKTICRRCHKSTEFSITIDRFTAPWPKIKFWLNSLSMNRNYHGSVSTLWSSRRNWTNRFCIPSFRCCNKASFPIKSF
jgi:hypothetical protein